MIICLIRLKFYFKSKVGQTLICSFTALASRLLYLFEVSISYFRVFSDQLPLLCFFGMSAISNLCISREGVKAKSYEYPNIARLHARGLL